MKEIEITDIYDEWVSFKEIFEWFNKWYHCNTRLKYEKILEFEGKEFIITNAEYLAVDFKDKEGNHFSLLPNVQREHVNRKLMVKTGDLYSPQDSKVIKKFTKQKVFSKSS